MYIYLCRRHYLRPVPVEMSAYDEDEKGFIHIETDLILNSCQCHHGWRLAVGCFCLHSVVEGLTHQRGHDDCWVLCTRSSLGLCWQKQGRLDEAEAVWREILPLQEAHGGQGAGENLVAFCCWSISYWRLCVPSLSWEIVSNYRIGQSGKTLAFRAACDV